MSKRCSLEGANVDSRAVDAERGEERFHDDWRASDDQAADDRQLASISVAAANGEAAADHANGAEDKPNQHDDAHRFARALGEAAAGSLSEDGKELFCEKCFHVVTFLPHHCAHAAPTRERPCDACAGILRSMNALNISAERLEHLRHLEAHLCEQIRGQDHVIPRIVAALHRGELGLTTSTRPRGSFLFLGPTGVGKTETTIAFTHYLLGSEKLFRFDMSEYQTQESVAVLIGGRVGEVGLLGLARSKSATGTLLFDEIEKAHPRVLDLFLQILDAARVTMASGDTLDLSGFYVVFTSNIAASEILTLQHSSFTTMERHVLAKAQRTLRPELYARIAEKLVFNRLSYDVQMEIARFHIARELSFLRDKGFHLIAGSQVISFVMQRGFHPRLGARPLRDAIEKHLRGAIADATFAEVRCSTLEFVVCANELVVQAL